MGASNEQHVALNSDVNTRLQSREASRYVSSTRAHLYILYIQHIIVKRSKLSCSLEVVRQWHDR